MKTVEEITLLMQSAQIQSEKHIDLNAKAIYDCCAWILESKPEPLFDKLVNKQRIINDLTKLKKDMDERFSD